MENSSPDCCSALWRRPRLTIVGAFGPGEDVDQIHAAIRRRRATAG
jgi:hypothetical protein